MSYLNHSLLVTANYMQKHIAASTSEKQKLIESCTLLTSVSPSVLSKLAEAVTWEMLPENTST